MADADVGMDKADLKKLLMRSKKEPVNCGVGMTKDGVVIMLDKIKQPKALVKELEKNHKDMKSPHWGQAFVDVDEDPKLVILTLNKAAPGMGRKMKKTLKGTGFSKVEIRLEDGSVAEKVGEEDEEGADGQQAAAAAPVAPDAAQEASSSSPPDIAPPADAAADGQVAEAAPAAADAPAAPAAPDAAAPAAGGLDAAALTRQLTELVKQMIPALSGDPSRAADLKGMAALAQGSLKSNDLEAAKKAIDNLQTALNQPAPAAANGAAANGAAAPGQDGQQAAAAPAAPAAQNGAGQNGAAPPNMAALGKARMAWSAARKKVESEVQKLHAEMTDHYKDHGFGAQLDKVFSSKIEPMMEKLDESLSDKLDEVTNNTDAAQHPKLIGEAKQIIKGYEDYLSKEPMIAKLDSNPFVPLAIQKTLSATLAALSRAVV